MKPKAMRWGLVTFCLGISSGLIGHYWSGIAAIYGVLVLSVFFAMLGGFAVSDED